nr:type II toxin-antitoxin system ParD family antitoxin [uncultured Halomonas sp.]
MISKDCYNYDNIGNPDLEVKTMNVSLTPQLEDYIKQKVAKGMYNSVSEVVREALRLLEERDALQAMKLEALRKDIHQGLESLDNGTGKPLDMQAIKTKGRKRLAGHGQ